MSTGIPTKPMRIRRTGTKRHFTAMHPFWGHDIRIAWRSYPRMGYYITEDTHFPLYRIHPGPYAYFVHALRALYEYLPPFLIKWKINNYSLTYTSGPYLITRMKDPYDRPSLDPANLNEGWTLYKRRRRLGAVKYQKYLSDLFHIAQIDHWSFLENVPPPVYPLIHQSRREAIQESPFIHMVGENALAGWPEYAASKRYDPAVNEYHKQKNMDPYFH